MKKLLVSTIIAVFCILFYKGADAAVVFGMNENTGINNVVTVTGDTMDVSGGLSIEIVGAPDTGMNTAQTIYFIGLIVLLCGVGIVYANAKPVDARQ